MVQSLDTFIQSLDPPPPAAAASAAADAADGTIANLQSPLFEIARMDVAALAAALQRYMGSEAVVRGCCGRLRDLAVDEPGREQLVSLGAVELIVEAMGRHGSAAGLNENGCWAMKNTAAGEDAAACARKWYLVDAGACGAIVSGMRRLSAYSGVQEQGCSAIRNLCYGSDEEGIARKQDCVEAGGLEAIVAAMSAHPSLVSVQEQGCGALVVLTTRQDAAG